MSPDESVDTPDGPGIVVGVYDNGIGVELDNQIIGFKVYPISMIKQVILAYLLVRKNHRSDT